MRQPQRVLCSVDSTDEASNWAFDVLRTTRALVTFRDKVIDIASALDSNDAIPAVEAQLVLIQELQTETLWKDITLPMIESVRRKWRDLVMFIERTASPPVYALLTDQIGESTEVVLTDFSIGINVAPYRPKVDAYIGASENHVAIAKVRHNRELTPVTSQSWSASYTKSEPVESRERFAQCLGNVLSLPTFIRSLVEPDRNAAQETFALFLDDNRYSSQQIRFVEMIIDRRTRHGVKNSGQLYQAPFTMVHNEGLDGAFGDSDAETIVSILSAINELAA